VHRIAELSRCVRPGGAIAFSAWGSAEETAAFQLIPTVARETLGEQATAPPAGAARRIDGSPAVLSALLRAAGLEPHVRGPVTRTLTCGSAEAFWERFALGAPGTRALLARLGEERGRAAAGR